MEVINQRNNRIYTADVDTNNSTIVIYGIRKSTNFYLNVSNDIMRIRTNRGYQVTLTPKMFYTMSKTEKVTHIKRKGDRAFRLV